MALRQATLESVKENLVVKMPVKQQIQAKPHMRPALSGLTTNTQISVANKHGAKKCDASLKPVGKVHDVLKPNTLIKQSVSKQEDSKTVLLSKPKIHDPDLNSRDDPQMVTEYIVEIFEHLRYLETKYAVKEDFLEDHKTTPKMRSIVVNWLVEIHYDFEQHAETLHLCISLLDRYLQLNKNVGRSTLQLVGTCALLIASKYEEMHIPSIEDYVYVCDKSFTEKQFYQMEIEMLMKLEFNLGSPSSIQFLRRYSKIIQAKHEHYTLAKYFLELTFLEHTMSSMKPSKLAAAACLLAKGVVEEIMEVSKLWTPTLVHYTTYEYNDFRNEMIELASIVSKAEKSQYQMVRKKYSQSSLGKASRNPKLSGPLIRKLANSKK